MPLMEAETHDWHACPNCGPAHPFPQDADSAPAGCLSLLRMKEDFPGHLKMEYPAKVLRNPSFMEVAGMSTVQVLALGLAAVDRFRCRKIPKGKKLDAHSWSVEQDFLAGVERGFRFHHRRLHPIILHCRKTKRSITLLTPGKIQEFNEQHHRTGKTGHAD